MTFILSNTAEYRVAELDHVHDQVARVRLLPTGARRVQYREGQYLSLELADGEQRSYSPAAAMAEDGTIELHVRLYANGRFSSLLREASPALGSLKVHGPYGDCVWQTPVSTTAPILLLATGTGIAPLKALLLAALADGCENPIWLYWGARHSSDLYEQSLFKALEQQHGNFHFVAVISPRHVQDCAAQQHPDLAHATVYACGLPAMVDAARTLLSQHHGLATERFFADSFVSATLPATADSAATQAVTINVTVNTEHLRVASGTSLLVGLRGAGVLKGICGGRQSCGTCRVSLTADGYALLTPATRAEKRLLQALPDVGELDRLACQIMLEPALDGLRVTLAALAI